MVKFKFLYPLICGITVLLNSCSQEEPDIPGQFPGPLTELSFGKKYEHDDSVYEYMVVDANTQKIELKVYDKLKNYAPVDTFNVGGFSTYHEIHDLEIRSMAEVDLDGHDWWGEYPDAVPDLNSFACAEFGDGETIHHSHGWFNVQNVKTDGEPQKVVITLPENNTGLIRGLAFHVGIDEILSIDEETGVIQSMPNVGYIRIYQLPKEDSTSDDSRFPMQIRYKGKLYSSMAEIDDNGEYHYDDPEFASMMNYLDNTPGIDAVVKDNLIVDYYDADDPVYLNILNGVDRPIDPTLSLTPVSTTLSKTRADGFEHFTQGSIGYYAAFSDGEFKGDYLTFSAKNLHNSHNLRDLKLIGMNDKLSSVAVYYGGDLPNVCAVLTVWENGNYNNDDNNIPRRKHRVSFIATYYNRKISRNSLKNVKLINASGSWNDRISALSFHFAYLDKPLMDY